MADLAQQSKPPQPLAFTGSALNRADNLRSDPQALAGMMNWRARLLLLDGLFPEIGEDGRLQWGTLADADPKAELVFLGLDGDKPCFAAVPDEGDGGPRMANPRLWSAMQALLPDQLALYGAARSLVDWHARHRHCAQCGGATQLAKGGWQRDCADCSAQHFPRTDPVTIMLVERDGQLLLGRGKGWPDRAYSALAGFVEPGESIEEAVAREVLEESGLVVSNVRYVASQPWPFPSQLMIGCHAMADKGDLVIDKSELADARWFSREKVQLAMEPGQKGPFNSPPPAAIAHYLLGWWLSQ